jgi:hypothetical protein
MECYVNSPSPEALAFVALQNPLLKAGEKGSIYALLDDGVGFFKSGVANS